MWFQTHGPTPDCSETTLVPGIFVAEFLPFVFRVVESGVVSDEFLGFRTRSFVGIRDEAEVGEIVGGAWIRDCLNEGRCEAAAGGAATPLPQLLGLIEIRAIYFA